MSCYGEKEIREKLELIGFTSSAGFRFCETQKRPVKKQKRTRRQSTIAKKIRDGSQVRPGISKFGQNYVP